MQPPPVRRPRGTASTWRDPGLVVLNAGAAIVTLMLLRFGFELSGVSSDTNSYHWLQRVTQPLWWPLEQIGGLSASVGGSATIAGVLTVLIVIVAWLGILGLVAGWQTERRRSARKT